MKQNERSEATGGHVKSATGNPTNFHGGHVKSATGNPTIFQAPHERDHFREQGSSCGVRSLDCLRDTSEGPPMESWT